MASDETWGKLRYFKKDSPTDKWGDPSRISDKHLLALDDFRHYIGVPIVVTSGVSTSGHSTNSYHYPQNGACATDIIIPKYKRSPFDLILDATKFGFNGIGYYPHWQLGGVVYGGLHLDSRPFKAARWMGVPLNGKQVYIDLTYENLLKYKKQ